MSKTPKKKLCWNCDGRVSMEEENCPFCGVYLSPAFNGQEEDKHSLVAPYRLVTTEEEIPKSPFHVEEEQPLKEENEAAALSPEANSVKQTVMTMALLFSGSILLFFGSLLMVFSENGSLTLHWNGEFWYVYLALSLPFLFLGWRGLNQLPEN